MPRFVRTFVLTLVLAAPLATAHTPAAFAQDPPPADSAAEARAQYGQGTQAFKEKRYSEAALHFEAAAGFRVSGVALYTAGLAWDLASRPERAADAYARALDVAGLDAKQTATAKERVASLERTLGTLAVTAPDGWKVQLDTFTEVPAPARLHGAPGVHALSIRAPGKPIERRDVSLDAGKTTSLELKEAPPPPPPPKGNDTEKKIEKPPPPPPPVVHEEQFWSTRRAVGVGVAGVGLMALGSTVILGLNANGAKDAYDAAPSQPGLDHASSLQTWTNVTLIGGLVLLAGGVVLVVLPNRDAPQDHAAAGPRVGLAPSGLAGTF